MVRSQTHAFGACKTLPTHWPRLSRDRYSSHGFPQIKHGLRPPASVKIREPWLFEGEGCAHLLTLCCPERGHFFVVQSAKKRR